MSEVPFRERMRAGAPPPQVGAKTIVGVLGDRAETQGDSLAFLFLEFGGRESRAVTYRELHSASTRIGGELVRRGCVGERVMLAYPPSIDAVEAFFGSLYARAPAVVVPLPETKREALRVANIIRDCRPRVLLTRSDSVESLSEYLRASGLAHIEIVATDCIADSGMSLETEDLDPDAVAFLQYTSGSTGTPRGVVVLHGNLFHNVQVIRHALGNPGEEFVGTTWVPLYHDMGLVGGVTFPLFLGRPNILFSPLAFAQRPMRWIKILSDYGVTNTSAPNFAYELCARVGRRTDLSGFDLSPLRHAVNGAEPIRPRTLARFAEVFERCGFRSTAFAPSYGLAECTLMVTGTDTRTELRHLSARTDSLAQGRFEPALGEERSIELVPSGALNAMNEVKIADPTDGRSLREGEVGEIWVRGESVTPGYFGGPQTDRSLSGDYLRTGDLGLVWGGALYVTGRLKDVIICNGVNHYPQDIEDTAERFLESVSASGRVVAFRGESALGKECAFLACELRGARREKPAYDQLARGLEKALLRDNDVWVGRILFLRPGMLSYTSSGKIQRSECKRRCDDGLLECHADYRNGVP